jgi:hypothetical protein
MLRRTRTTKKLARRIDLQYFTRPHPFRSWRFWLSVAVPVLALGWLLTQRAQGGQKVYSSGPLSQSHAVFTQQCNLCHVAQAGVFSKAVRDQACLTCHDAPLHQARQVFTPACSSCHLEHQGALRLAATSDRSCTQCHSRLQTRNGPPQYSRSIEAFDHDHPEFSPLSPNKQDPGQIRLNHYLHLQPNLLGLNNQRVQMTCEDCHRATGSNEPWPYAGSQSEATEVGSTAPNRSIRSDAYMAPIRFANHCSGCHTLQFDRRFADLQVPHDRPELVHAFLTKQFEQYIGQHPSSIHEVEPPNRQLPERIRIRPVARNAAEWIGFRVEQAEWLLWTKTCKQCHVLTETGGPVPEVAKSNITARWLPHAEFDHHAHRMMSCVACHARAQESHDTADVLLPGIQTCRQCHRESSSKDVAESRCFECHQYHDWTKAKRNKSRFTIPELRGTAQLAPLNDEPH